MALRLARKPAPTTISDRRDTVAWLCEVIDYVDQKRDSVVVFPRPFLDAEMTSIAPHVNVDSGRSALAALVDA